MKNLLLVCPTYGPPPDPEIQKNHRTAMMFAANNGVRWCGEASTDRVGWAKARNLASQASLAQAEKEPIDGVIWLDDDVKIPLNTIPRLLQYEKDFIVGLYFQRVPPYLPLMANLNEKEDFQFCYDYPKDSLIPVDGVGLGCAYTSINLLKKVSKLPECKDGIFGGLYDNSKPYGEDFLFCLRAKKVGVQPYIDTAIKCEHFISPRYSSETLFLKYRGTLL